MSARRKAIRQRDLVSYGRRTPRFDFARLRAEAREVCRAEVLTLRESSAKSESEAKEPPIRSVFGKLPANL